jgi:hypothetical protein
MHPMTRYLLSGLARWVTDRRRMPPSLILIICLTAAGLQPRSVIAYPATTAIQESHEIEIEQALSDLFSINPFTSEAARNHIFALGQQAIEPLMAMLKRSLDEVTEEQGAPTETSSGDPLRDSITRFKEPNWKVIDSCCYFLGRLKVIAAVPLLIRVIEITAEEGGTAVITGISAHGLGNRTAEVTALESIGAAAEPALWRELRTPRWALESLRIGNTNDDPNTLRAKEYKVREIRTQVIAVLAGIGNEDTMFALESLRDNPEFANGPEKSMIETAIRQISKKANPIR